MTKRSAIKGIIRGRDNKLGELGIRRVVPTIEFRNIGPFVFLDYFGPVNFEPGQGIDVRPHPHINLATVTYLLDGEIFHRDSLGYAQAILPGAVNLMVAGRGITHSERTRPELRASGYRLHGFQLWMALPEADEGNRTGFLSSPGRRHSGHQYGRSKNQGYYGRSFWCAISR